ncbi:MAG: MBL fold metallo-hydrolase [Chitinophagales bacterium]|nr:MBL fold metallo-hydrolase [Chitinophagales bacterium]
MLRVVGFIFLLAVAVAASVLFWLFQPSANLNNFKTHFAEPYTADSIPQGKVVATFFGTSTILFDDGETQLLIDGFFTRSPAIDVVLGKVSADSALIHSVIEKHRINRLKGIFVCHSHYDHAMDAPVVSKITGATLYGSLSTLNIGRGVGLSENAMQQFEPFKKFEVGKFTVTVIPSKHTPPVTILGKTNATDPAHPNIDEPLIQPASIEEFIEGGTYDFYVQHGGHSALIKASTNYIPHALDSFRTDVFFLGCALLSKQTDEFRNSYFKHTVVASHAKTLVPVHWDNFSKPITQPLQALPKFSDDVSESFSFLINESQKHRVNFMLLRGGERVLLF